MAKSADPRDESEEERADRNLGELLQELRVAGLGVQVLFGFLLSLPFTNRFTNLSPGQRNLYLPTIVRAAVATALLLGPVAYHRLVFRQGEKERLVRAANVMAIAGLAAVGLAVSAAILLVTDYVSSGLTAALITAFVTLLFAGLWFALPLARRRCPQTASASAPAATWTSARLATTGIAWSSWVRPNSRRTRRRAQTTRRLAPCAAACRAASASTPSPAASMKLTRSRSATSGRPAAASVTSRSRNPAAEAKSTSPATVTSTYPGSCRTRMVSSSSSSGPRFAASIKTALSGRAAAQPPSVITLPHLSDPHPRSRRRRGGL